MSLAQHVSAVEGIDHEPEPGDPGFDTDRASLRSIRSYHRLTRQPSITLSISYDPIPPVLGDKGVGAGGAGEKLEPIPAYEVGWGKRVGRSISASCLAFKRCEREKRTANGKGVFVARFQSWTQC